MLDWVDNTIPLSTRFDDTYYSVHDGQAETVFVYIDGNDLIPRWNASKDFIIAELGFGTGLNFLETCRQWQSNKLQNSQLDFISFEQYPLNPDEIAKALSRWPQLKTLTHQLCDNWNISDRSISIEFGTNCHLTVYFGDANDCLCNKDLKANAWYLDGFSPAKNPELWNEALMQMVFENTAPSGTFATYSVAGMVRRNLQSAGFEFERRPGFATKREMLTGYKPK